MCADLQRERSVTHRDHRRGPRPLPAPGFTLIELLVAITILGLVMGVVYGALSRTLYTKGYAEDRAELYAAGREAVLKMSEEIEAALPPNPLTGIDFRTQSRGDRSPADAVQFAVSMHSGLRGVAQRSGRSTITYSLDPLRDSNVFFILRRDEFPLLNEPPDRADQSEDAPPTPKPTSVYLLDPSDCTDRRFCVVGLRLRYLDLATGTWLAEWDSTQQDHLGQLPAAAEISLRLSDNTGTVHDFATVVDLVLTPRVTPTPGRT